MSLEPLRDQLVLQEILPNEQTPGGLFLPEQAREKTQTAIVMAVGPGRPLENGTVRPMSLKPGDVVMYSRYGGSDIEIKGRKFILINEDQIYGILRED